MESYTVLYMSMFKRIKSSIEINVVKMRNFPACIQIILYIAYWNSSNTPWFQIFSDRWSTIKNNMLLSCTCLPIENPSLISCSKKWIKNTIYTFWNQFWAHQTDVYFRSEISTQFNLYFSFTLNQEKNTQLTLPLQNWNGRRRWCWWIISLLFSNTFSIYTSLNHKTMCFWYAKIFATIE